MMTRLRLLAVALTASAVATTALVLATATSLEPLPATLDPAPTEHARPRLVDRNGVPLNTSYTSEWNVHDQLALHEIPLFLREAFIHAEDKRFRSHQGPDWLARSAALATNLRYRDSIRGASTISEQVVRMLHPRPRTVWSRWLEGFEAARLEQRFSKDEILAFYLNQVPYAARRRGVHQAAELYFSRDLETLSDREMLALAVLVRSPGRLDLYRNPDAANGAIERLANTLRKRQIISEARHDTILATPFDLQPAALTVAAPHFLRFVVAASARDESGGKVVTTLDARLQARTQELIDQRLRQVEELGVHHGAVLVADNASGEVLAWAVAGGGGANGPESHIDPVTSLRQPGSALKPFLYALALERGKSLADIIVDAPLAASIGDGLHNYRNYSERHYGPVSLRHALANSLNIPALKLLREIGTGDYLNHLQRHGIESLDQHPDYYGDGLALGNGEISLYELVQAYLTLANRGRATRLTVLRAAGEPLTGKHSPGEQVLSPETVSLIADALSDPDARSAEFGRDSVLNLPVQTAVKTGTSSDFRDAWAVGFDSRFTVGIWMGNLDQTPTNGITGSTGPALLLRSVFAWLNRDGSSRPLYLSPKLTRHAVCMAMPAGPTNSCVERDEWFAPSSMPPAEATHKVFTPQAAETDQKAMATHIRLRQPTPDLELAMDPRLPEHAQAFQFLLDGVRSTDEVEWTINQTTAGKHGNAYTWPVTRGAHSVSASISRDGILIAEIEPVEFVVR